MDLNEEQIAELETALEQLHEIDPAQMPEPATELANLLNQILEDLEAS